MNCVISLFSERPINVAFPVHISLLLSIYFCSQGSIGEQVEKLDRMMLEYEDLCDRVELEKKKAKQKTILSILIEKRQ